MQNWNLLLNWIETGKKFEVSTFVQNRNVIENFYKMEIFSQNSQIITDRTEKCLKNWKSFTIIKLFPKIKNFLQTQTFLQNLNFLQNWKIVGNFYKIKNSLKNDTISKLNWNWQEVRSIMKA